MGFNIKTAELLFHAKKYNIDFNSVVTIGRQQLNGSYHLFQKLFSRYGVDTADLDELITREKRYAEGFLRRLGAKKIDAIDASSYESASLIHDMNNPIPKKWKSKYSLVIDSGSLEHIFNFPQAIKNCMDMVQTGGHMIGITPANNFLGHGFYQFSPELFYRIFSLENGFKIKKMWLFFPELDSSVYEVKDPNDVGDRVSLRNNKETFLFYIAEKIAEKQVFSIFPQQSDYENIIWKSTDMVDHLSTNNKRLKSKIPPFIKLLGLRGYRKMKDIIAFINPIGTGNKKYFKKENIEF